MKRLSMLMKAGFLMPMLFLLSLKGISQDCENLNFAYTTTESRCTATGSIKVVITGGSGNYNVKVTGPVTTGYTSSTNITGLSAGTYTVTVKDISTGCVTDKYGVVVPGSYGDPRYTLIKTDVTCMNGSDGTVSVSGLQYGRAPFTYKLVAPSPSHLGQTNTTGTFTGLIAGEYAVELKDSCGGQQTRRITVLNYTWWIDGVTIAKVGCDSAMVSVKVKDSKGNLNTNASLFPGFSYGVVRSAGDTVWSANSNFTFYLDHKRSVTVVIKDPCGTMQVTTWLDSNIPSVNASLSTSNYTCNTFDITVTGQTNLTSPSYKLLNSANQELASNTTGIFTGVVYGTYCIKITEACYDTTFTRCVTGAKPKPSVNADVDRSNKVCSTFTAAIYGQTNMTTPVTYELYTAANVLVSTNNTGIFNSLPYGSYCMKIKNGCNDTTITRCFTESVPLPKVNDTVTVENRGCNTFTANVYGQTNLTNPEFCLYNSSNVKITCNTTGKFENLGYGTYCIRINNDDCYDTTLTRCFTVKKLIPSYSALTYTNKTCSTYTATITGSNLDVTDICLYNSSNVQVACSSTGQFNNLVYGETYCAYIYNNASCYDTTIKKCFSQNRPIPSISTTVTISNKACSTFTAKASGSNLTSPKYILYNSADVAIDSNTSGTFNNVIYGSYCIRIRNSCYDTTMKVCFQQAASIPSVGNVTASNKVCSGFTATLSNPFVINGIYKLYDTLGNQVATSSNGVFNNLAYGSYCMKITTPCYDTTITRCFTENAAPIDINVWANESCTFGTTDINVSFTSGSAPYTVYVLNPVGVQVTSITSSSTSIAIKGLPPLSNSQQYKVIGMDNCSGRDTALVTPLISTLQKTNFVKSKCPSGVWENGATDIDVDVSSNMGTVTPVIISKNGANVTINYTSNSGTTYKFIDLEPATYIMAYSVPTCTGKVYDTIVVAPYSFPSLQQSAAYQCDNNNFSVGAAVTGGTTPFTFEIIGSIPDTPSIIASAQTNPVFNITNGVQYTLVRLRAVDACGNATLNDVNILPLANTVIYASSDCYYDNITLNVDSIPNATYSWYRKTSATDSTLISSSQEYIIPYLLPSDTGTYICRISVNGGCLTKISYFTVTGACGFLLPGQIKLSGQQIGSDIQLNWEALQDADVTEYFIERRNGNNGAFVTLGKVTGKQKGGRNLYVFTDANPEIGMNNYRLRIINKSGSVSYTNTVGIRIVSVNSISLYPNPVDQHLNIAISAKIKDNYKLVLMNTAGQIVHEQVVQNVQQTVIPYQRTGNIRSGIYMLHVTAIGSQESFVYKIIFK